MNDKTRNKLNHILEAVPMSREHKNMLVEVFDEVSAGTSGGGNKETYDIILNTKTNKIYFQNIEYNCNIEITNDGGSFIDVTNNELHKVLIDHLKSNNIIDMLIFEDLTTIKSRIIAQLMDPNTEMIFIITFTEGMTSITIHS